MKKSTSSSQLPVEVCLALGQCYTHLQQWPAAQANFSLALQLAPGNDQAYIGLGRLAWEQERFPEAQDCFTKALACNRRSDVALSGLGEILLLQGQNREALDKFRQALELNPENRDALVGWAQAAHLPEDLQAIAARLRAYLERRLVDFQALAALAEVLLKTGDHREAHIALKKILLFEPANPTALSLLAKINREAA
jgi:tetratricopeptide (TPR) repeat protein